MNGRPFIALVDDEASVRRALARMLNASRFEVAVFASGAEFLDFLPTRLPDCVVLDFQMPGLTARDVQRQLAQSQTRIPVIIITAHDQPTLREQCLADGAVAYLAKPLRRDHLVAAINAAVQRPKGSA